MAYSDLFIKQEKKVPIFFVLITLLLVIGSLNFFFRSARLPTRASSDYPRQVKVGNIGKNKAVVFWESAKKETGYLLLGEDSQNINRFILDDNDTVGFKKPRYFHFVTLNNLKEATKYYFKIVSGEKIFVQLDNQPFSFQTLGRNSLIFNSKPLYGKVVNEKGEGVSDLVLIFYNKDLPYMITRSKSTGDWLVVLQREKKSFSDEEVINIEIYKEGGEKSFVRAKLKSLSPLSRPIVLGKDYDLIGEETQVLAATSEGGKNQVLKLMVIYPQENAVIAARKPLIKGTALPNTIVDIVLHGKEIYSFKTKADEKGNWNLSLPIALSPGDYFLEVIGEGKSKNQVKIFRHFRIAKSGEMVLGEATPSATLAPTQSPSLTALVTPTTAVTSPSSLSSPSPTIYKTGSFDWFWWGSLATLSIATGLFFILVF